MQLHATYSTRDARGLESAERTFVPIYHPKGRRTRAQQAGIAYEKKVLRELALQLHAFTPHPFYKFWKKGKLEFAIPDAICLSLDGKTLGIIEIKVRHTADAWLQLNHLYLPIIEKAHPNLKIKLLEVCRSYDPAVFLPDHEMVLKPRDWIEESQGSQYGVHILARR